MEEKRKLEKIIFSDLDRAKHDYDNLHEADRTELEKRLKQNPEALAILKKYEQAEKDTEATKNALRKMGYDTSYEGDYNNRKMTLTLNTYGTTHKELRAFLDNQEKTKDKLEALKRTYTIKLFAGGVEAQEIFANLQAEIAKLLK